MLDDFIENGDGDEGFIPEAKPYRPKNNNQRERGGRQQSQQMPPRGMGGGKRGYFHSRRRVCPIKVEDINWKNIDGLRYFVGENGEIRPRRKTGATAKQQRRATIAIKQARHMALLPFTSEHIRISRKG